MRVAIVGAGFMGRLHARAWAQQPGCTVAAVVDAAGARAAELAAEFSALTFFGLDQCLDRVDAVSVCTPPESHRRDVVAAARAGRHVLLEKPAGRNAADYAVMLEETRRAGVTALVGMTHRFYPEMAAARQWVQEGRIGEVVSVLDQMYLPGDSLPGWYWDPQVAGGGVLTTNGIHALDRIQWVLGLPMTEIRHAQVHHLERRSAEDWAALDLTLGARVIAHIRLCWATGTDPLMLLEVVGTRGVLRVRSWEGLSVSGPGGGRTERFYAEGEDFANRTLRGIAAEVAAFRAAVAGQVPNPSTLVENHAVFEQIQQAYRMAQGG